MNIPRHTLSSHVASPAFVSAQFASAYTASGSSGGGAGTTGEASGSRAATAAAPSATGTDTRHSDDRGADLFACATSSGFLVAQANPLKVVARRDFPEAHGGLAHAAAVDGSSLLVLVGGGRVPRFAPNKVILWDEAAQVIVAARSSSFGGDGGGGESSHTASPPASTIFSAGSNFDTQAASASSAPITQPQTQAQQTSSVKLTEAEQRIDDWRQSALSSSSSSSTLDKGKARAEEEEEGQLHLSIPDMDASTHSSVSATGTQNLSQSLFERASRIEERKPSLLSASSAGLDDPFASAPAAASPSTSPRIQSALLPEEQPAIASPPSSSSSSHRSLNKAASASAISTAHAPAPHSHPAAPPTTTTTAPFREPQKGREVAELEFGETVRGVCVRAFDIARPIVKQPTPTTPAVPAAAEGKGKRRRTNFSGANVTSAKTTEPTHDRVVVLVVLLRKRAVVFEIGAPERGLDEKGQAAWEIRQRAETEICEGGTPGLAALSSFPSRNAALVALPGRQTGHVQLLRIVLCSGSRTSASGATSILAAHTSHLAALTLSYDGTLLATASERGTLLRVWSTVKAGSTMTGVPGAAGQVSATLQRELRRGTDPARIMSLAFAPDRSAIAAASDKGTVHIFNLAPSGDVVQLAVGQLGRAAGLGEEQGFNLSRAASRFLPSAIGDLASAIPKGMLPKYFKSSWSVAQYRIPLKTFSGAAAERALAKPVRARATGTQGAQAAVGGGGARSTEGAWATMRGRVDDIRRGEPGVEESIFLGWIEAQPSFSSATPINDVESSASTCRWNLVALTTSGGYYRIQLDASDEEAALADEQSTTGADESAVLDMYREDGSSTAGASSASTTTKRRRRRRRTGDAQGCTLVEYRGFGQRDDWTQS